MLAYTLEISVSNKMPSNYLALTQLLLGQQYCLKDILLIWKQCSKSGLTFTAPL